MSFKQFHLEEVPITIYKRRGAMSLKLSIVENAVRVTIPAWSPYRAGLEFARSRLGWIRLHLKSAAGFTFKTGMAVGKHHHMYFKPEHDGVLPRTRVTDTAIYVYFNANGATSDVGIQEAAAKAAVRALKKQAQQLLPARVEELATRHDYAYSSVHVKQLKRRWGSCDSHRNLTFNLFLMQLPWSAIDYVILHELAHTKEMHHGPAFWQEMSRSLPDVQTRRKIMHNYQPVLGNWERS